MKNPRAAVKFGLIVVMTVTLYAFWWLVALVIPNKQFWREIIYRRWALWFVKIANIKIEVIGKSPTAPFFMVCNHLSYADIPAIRATVEGIFVAKSEISKWFLCGRLTRDMGNIFIDRSNRRDIPRAGNDILNALNRGEGVIIFPEGTSTKGEKILPFKSSFFEFASQTRLPVHFATITYQTPKGELPASRSVCWWDETPLGELVWQFFALTKIKMIITFGENPILEADRKKLAAHLWEAMNEQFIPVL